MASDLTNKQEGEKIIYHTCMANCGATYQCVFKSHVKDGVVVRIEPDDRYNTGVGRGTVFR